MRKIKLAILLLFILSSPFLFLPLIKANIGCCENTTQGFLCQEVDVTECKPGAQFSPLTCENTLFCKTGCCVSDDGCSVTTGSLCVGENVTFLPNSAECNIQNCQKICCILDGEALVMPQARCEKEALRKGLDPVIVPIANQTRCTQYFNQDPKGCCKLNEIQKCTYTSLTECGNQGIFTPGRLCSQVPDCSCTRHFRKGCHSSDLSKVFYLDSCGNPEEVYMSCGQNKCTEQGGDAICSSQSCNGKRIGYMWCGQDYNKQQLIQIEGRPPVGWSDYVYICGPNNIVQIEELDASGSEICVDLGNGNVRVVQNTVEQCFGYSDKDTCENNELCMWVDQFTEYQALDKIKSWAYDGYDLEPDYQTDIRGFETASCFPKYPLNDPSSCDQGTRLHSDEARLKLTGWSEVAIFTGNWHCLPTSHARCYIGGGLNSGDSDCMVSGGHFLHWATSDINLLFTNNPGTSLSAGSGGDCIEATDREAIWTTAMAKRCRQLGSCGSYENLVDYRSPLSTKIKKENREVVNLFGGANFRDTRVRSINNFFDPEDRSPYASIGSPYGSSTEVRTPFYYFYCEEWQPSPGGTNCQKCNENTSKPCNPVRCQSLGQLCTYDERTRACTAGQSPDILPPIVNPCYKSTSTQPNTDCQTSFDVENYQWVTLKLTTNEPAQCIFTDDGIADPDFNNPQYFLPNQSYLTYHERVIVYQPEGQDIMKDLKYNCRDQSGNSMTSPGHIYFKVKSNSSGDNLPPELINTLPENNSMINSGLDKIELTVYLNEPSVCRWFYQDTTFEGMPIQNEFNATDGMGDPLTFFGIANVTIQPNMINTIYLRCKDNSSNVNPLSYVLTFNPAPELLISKVEPKQDEVFGYCLGNQQEKIVINVTTEAGINSGIANCSWKNSSSERWTKFTNTNSNIHSTEFPLKEGINTLIVQCTDSASFATETITFTTTPDITAPEIIRVSGGNQLTIKTNEPAKCAFNRADSCSFNATDILYADPFFTGDQLTHTTSWKSKPWYVKCYDACGNGNVDPSTRQLTSRYCKIIYPQNLN